MAAQRNNIAKMPWELREIVCRGLFDGGRLSDVAAEVVAAAEVAGLKVPRPHNSSFLAYKKSAEYTRYCDLRRNWDERLISRRWAAKVIEDADGPAALADMAELQILEQLHSLAEGGLLETGKDVATVARAITSMQRTHLAKKQFEAERRLQEQEEKYEQLLAEREAEIARLESVLEEKSGAKKVDAAKVADALDEVLGVKK